MSETEYNLRAENLRLKMALAECQSQMLQMQHAAATAELDALMAARSSASTAEITPS